MRRSPRPREPGMSEWAIDDMTAVHAAINELLQAADDLQQELGDGATNRWLK